MKAGLGGNMQKVDNNIKISVRADTSDLLRILELSKKLKFELIEINKQLKNINKLGITKRQLKKFIKEWFKK